MVTHFNPLKSVWYAVQISIALLLVSTTIGALFVLYARAGHFGSVDIFIRKAAVFVGIQAVLSTILSVTLGLLCAKILYRFSFSRTRIFEYSLALPIVFPIISAITGLLDVWGNNGWLMALTKTIFSSNSTHHSNIYGLYGILLAHIFFNFPLATKYFLHRFWDIPKESMFLAHQFHFGFWDNWKHLEKPAVIPVIPRVAAIIFLFCISSFTIIMVLGGGPAAATPELMIYQALRMEFNLPKMGTASFVHSGLALLPVLILIVTTRQFPLLPPENTAGSQKNYQFLKISPWFLIIPAGLFLLLIYAPIIKMVTSGLATWFLPEFWQKTLIQASIKSLNIACMAVVIGAFLLFCLICLSLCIYKRFGKIAGKLSEIPAFLPLIVSPVTMGTSLILITATRPYIIESWHTLLIAFINAITFLPIGFALVMPRVLDINDHWFFLQESLHCSSVIRIAKIYIPLAKHSISLFLGLIAGFSLSDLTTISVLGYTETPTLPLLVLRQMSNYHFQWASGTALLLVCLCVIVFTIFKRYGTYD